MERKYDIDIQFLNYLKGIISECQTLQKNVDLFLIERLIHILEDAPSCGNSGVNVERQLSEDLQSVKFYRPYYPFVKTFRSKGMLDDTVYCPRYHEVFISNGDTVSLVHDFYKGFGSLYEDDLKDFMDDLDGHIKFVKPKPEFEGETTFIKSTGDFFCLIPNYSNFTKATIMAHEATHVLDWYRNPDFIKAYLINEVNSLFKEMLASDYFAEQLNLGDDNVKRRYYLHTVIKKYADDIYYRTQILYLFARDSVTHNKRMIYEKFGEDYLKYLTQDSLIENYIYQIAYLIAIELYYIYKMGDRDKALWLANRIVMIGNNDNILDILRSNGIVLNSHSLEYEEDMKLKLAI